MWIAHKTYKAKEYKMEERRDMRRLEEKREKRRENDEHKRREENRRIPKT